MKKQVFIILIALFLLVGLSACGSDTKNDDAAKDNEKETTEENNKNEESGKDEVGEDREKDSKETKSDESNKNNTGDSMDDAEVLRVGMELKWPPFEMADMDGKPDGISVLIAEELGKYLGRKVEIVDLSFSTLIPALESEKIDVIIGSMGITEERAEKIDFSEPYMYFKLLTVVNKDSKITSVEDLFSKENLKFVSPKSFMAIDIIKEKANNPTVLEFDDKAGATLELVNGNADAFVIDAVSAVQIAKNYPDNVEVIYEPVYVSDIGMGIRKGDTELLEKANEFISKLDKLGVNENIELRYGERLRELVGKGYDFYLNED